MKLSRNERFIIVNQLRILEALYPDEANSYINQRIAFESGYESHYEWSMESIATETISEDTSREVIDVLDMFRAFYYYKKSNECLKDIDEKSLLFSGYDGNDPVEIRLMEYAKYFINDLGKFKEVLEFKDGNFDFNSNTKKRSKYKRMLSRWLKIDPGMKKGQRHRLTKEQLIDIIDK